MVIEPAPESTIRERLDIPADADKVLVFAESSHWDPDWLFTFDEYYRLRVRKVLNAMIEALEEEERRIYSIEAVFFLKMFWEREPDRRSAVKRFLNQGRIRLSGSGINTPDTILPEAESIIRDYLQGQEWLREKGIESEPRIAYLPDNFGNTPFLPSLLTSLGFEYAAMSRIDGLYFLGADFLNRGSYPLQGSTAAVLLKKHRSIDFIWREENGAELLCHLNPYTYGQGDLLTHIGVAKLLGFVVGLPFHVRSPGHVARRIQGYVKQLERFSRTPYMLCPIGLDFNEPIPQLVSLLDRYNSEVYPESGIFAVNAALEDYMDLVSHYASRLPVLNMDPNPTFMGFYSSRPEMKQRCKTLSFRLITAEKIITCADHGKEKRRLDQELENAWDKVVVPNHHDFITGTSPNRVWRKEQRPFLLEAQGLVDKLYNEAASGHDMSLDRFESPSLPQWEVDKGKLRVETASSIIELDERAGGCITTWTDKITGEKVLEGPGNDIISYEDSGGLWRMGHEYRGGRFREKERSSQGAARIRAAEKGGALEVRVESELEGRAVTRTLWFRADSPIIWMRTEGWANDHRTVTARFPTTLRPRQITMDVTAGMVERPLVKLYDPTFWAAKTLAFIQKPKEGRGFVVFMAGPSVISCNNGGEMELVVMRNTRKEKAFGIFPLMGFPAAGADHDKQTLDYAVLPTDSGGWWENRLHKLGESVLHPHWRDPEEAAMMALSDSLIMIDNEELSIMAIKRAQRGDGLIVRLFMPFPKGEEVILAMKNRDIKEASLCDARERDREKIAVKNGKALVPLHNPITTARLQF
jgi:hypothetical protein